MRDSTLKAIYKQMQANDRIFFLSGDFGAPTLDLIRQDFADRFINVGIAEQNLINVSTGLALEGYIVYAYAIAGFITMRAYEQVRTNLALMSQVRDLNVNLIGVGSGVSYDVSGPSHHCLEDIGIMRTLPNMTVCCPSDWVTAQAFIDYTIEFSGPKYLRLDSKPVAHLYDDDFAFDWKTGFCEIQSGNNGICLVSTGYTTHWAKRILAQLGDQRGESGLIDLFMLTTFDSEALATAVSSYQTVITLEEGFRGKGGLDSLMSSLICRYELNPRLLNFGFNAEYAFRSGTREFLYNRNGMSEQHILNAMTQL